MSKSRNEYKSVYGKDFDSDYSDSGKKKNPNKVSTIFGIILSILQLVTSVFLMIKLVTINILTMPLTIGLGVVLGIFFLITIIFATRGTILRRIGKILSIIVIIICLLGTYFVAPLTKIIDTKGAAVSEDPFVVYVSASDTFGELADSKSNGRSDTNILAIVNPKTNTVALISTPRDYYVEIQAGKNIAADSYDKLTHCGLYGSGEPAEPTSPSEWGWGQEVTWKPGYQVLMNTLSNLYGIQINGKALTTDSPEYHYLRLNFTGFSELIDELGGITVNVEEGFSTYTYANYTDKDMQTNKSKRKKYTFTKGKMKMDGATALTYARERHSFANGDVQRNKNQISVIKAMTDKMLSVSTLTNYNKIINAIGSSFTTDMDLGSLANLQLKKQLSAGYNGWNIVSYSVSGLNDGYKQCTWNGQNLSVLSIDETSVANASSIIEKVLGGEDYETVQAYVDSLNADKK